MTGPQTPATRVARITRGQLYRRAMPGSTPWTWAYKVEITGEPYPFDQGPGLRRTLNWLRRAYPDAQIVLAWEESSV